MASDEASGYTADFAIYAPDYSGDGVWDEEVVALKTMLEPYGWTYKTIGPQDILNGILRSGDRLKFRALISPGGMSYPRELALGQCGDGKVRDFVQAGGSFVGFCAGAYWAVKTVRVSMTGQRYSDYPYQLQLFPGVGQGPLGWMPWNNGTNANLDLAEINTSNATMSAIGMPARTRFLYGGGPWFQDIDLVPGKCEVWARAIEPAGTPKAQADGNGKPTIILFEYGKGKAILFAYHPDVLINNMADGVCLSKFYNEKSMKWNWGNQTEKEVNLNSWNIVHAALQIAAGQAVTRLTKLP